MEQPGQREVLRHRVAWAAARRRRVLVPNYSLGHNGYCESCSSCGEIFFQHRLNLLQHDAQYVDLYEQTLYNALLGSMDLEGKNFYYDNPLDEGKPRYDWHVCPCCVGNIPRTLLALPTWMYAQGRAMGSTSICSWAAPSRSTTWPGPTSS